MYDKDAKINMYDKDANTKIDIWNTIFGNTFAIFHFIIVLVYLKIGLSFINNLNDINTYLIAMIVVFMFFARLLDARPRIHISYISRVDKSPK